MGILCRPAQTPPNQTSNIKKQNDKKKFKMRGNVVGLPMGLLTVVVWILIFALSFYSLIFAFSIAFSLNPLFPNLTTQVPQDAMPLRKFLK